VDTIVAIIKVFGLVSLVLLVLGIWTTIDLRKKSEADSKCKQDEPDGKSANR